MTSRDAPGGPDWKAVAIGALILLQIAVGFGVTLVLRNMAPIETATEQARTRLEMIEQVVRELARERAQADATFTAADGYQLRVLWLEDAANISERLARIEERLNLEPRQRSGKAR